MIAASFVLAIGTVNLARGETGTVTLLCTAAPGMHTRPKVVIVDYDRRTAQDERCNLPSAAKISEREISWAVRAHDMPNHCGEADLEQTATYKLDRVSSQLAYDEGIAADNTIVYECVVRKF
jgi:hypothetical protein